MNDQSVSDLHSELSAKQEFIAAWKSARDGESGRPSDLGICPYPGLRSFRPNEADLFYGREAQIKELRDLLADHNIIVVLGGSGSGKSSLVRAGLVPQLNSTAPIPGRPGAWYVVEFRPKLDPVNELFDAIFNQIILPALTVPSPSGGDATGAGHDPEMAKERARRIAAINAAFDLECEPDAPNENIQWQCRTRLRDVLFDGDVIDVGALFDFVDERLQKLDEALSGGASSGAPNLLLLIDQFEEVFKPKVDQAGSKMIMSLITSIHTYRPFNLFLIITMRSEELHRCSEYLGVTEVVNSSMYLVDLIGGRDIEKAIVEPARRVLKSWGLDPGDAETGPFTRRALSVLHQVFDDGREVLPHPADQLPLMQHMLPMIWDKAIERWDRKPDQETLQIDVEDFEALPGWDSVDGQLIGTLNERANDVLRRAIARGARKTDGALSEEEVGRLLRAAFCCLAQLDDRGNVVRDFATLDQMLAASGVYERQPDKRNACKTALEAALGVFQRATLVNVGTNYDVNHEALIRGWKTYANWLKDASRRVDRLVTVDHIIADSGAPQELTGLARIWAKLAPGSEVERCAKASQVAGVETSADLQDVLGPDGAFSDQWARQTLERSDAASPNPRPDPRSIEERLGAIRQTVRDALRYPEVKARQLNLRGIYAVLGVVALAGLTFLIRQNIVQQRQSALQDELAKQFRLFRLQSEVTAPNPNGRQGTADRELYAAMTLALENANNLRQKPLADEARNIFLTSIRLLDAGARNVLGNASVVRIMKNSDEELSRLQKKPAHCAIADGQAEPELIGKDDGALGIKLEVQEPQGADETQDNKPKAQDYGFVRPTKMVPIWRAPGGRVVPMGNSANFVSQPLPPRALVCLSDDGNWLLTWLVQSMRQQTGADGFQPPFIQRIVWIRTAPTTIQDDRWRAEIGEPRLPGTAQSYDDLIEGDDSLNREYSSLYKSVANGEPVFQSFRQDENVGFLIKMSDDRTAMLWTTTALVDPDPVTGRLKEPLKDCNFESSSKSDEKGQPKTYKGCVMGPIRFDEVDHMLEAEYVSTDGYQLQSLPRSSAATCATEDALCQTDLHIKYDPVYTDKVSRVVISHLSSTIKAAAIWDGALWVRDANGQEWRYLVGFDRIRELVPRRWMGIKPEVRAAKGEFSPACKQAGCAKVEIPGWESPGSP